MRARRFLVATLVTAGVFALVLALTFPTDAIVRWALARVTPQGSGGVVFARARLRPWGLRLEEVSVHGPDGGPVASAEWLTFRPSFLGLVRDMTGRPWHAGAGVCGGTFDAVLDRDGEGDVVTVSWGEVDLAHCPPAALLGEDVAGLAHGNATLRRPPAPADGELVIRSAWWKGAGRFLPGVQVLHADPATFRWTLADGRLALDTIELQGPEVRATGRGTVTPANPAGQSALDLELAITAGPEAPPELRDLLARLPRVEDNGDARRLRVGGTLAAPRQGRGP